MKTQHAQTAQAIRKVLKESFPTVKFSVRSEGFAGGDAVRVKYENGPTREEVEKLIRKFESGHFNGMEDIYEYDNLRSDIPQVKYVQITRDFSKELEESTKKEIAEKFGIEIGNEEDWKKKMGYWSSIVVYQHLIKQSF